MFAGGLGKGEKREARTEDPCESTPRVTPVTFSMSNNLLVLSVYVFKNKTVILLYTLFCNLDFKTKVKSCVLTNGSVSLGRGTRVPGYGTGPPYFDYSYYK